MIGWYLVSWMVVTDYLGCRERTLCSSVPLAQMLLVKGTTTARLREDRVPVFVERLLATQGVGSRVLGLAGQIPSSEPKDIEVGAILDG